MEEPVEPKQEDCCNSGCNPCIFDVYEKQLQFYKKWKYDESISHRKNNGISQLKYINFVISDVIGLTNILKVIKFRKKEKNSEIIWWNPGDHFLVKYSTDLKSCTRAYTPIKNVMNNDEYDFYIILKKYDKGLVSNFLFNLNIGDETFWRGPYGSYELEPNKFKRLVMIAQGTGLAPFVSIIETILQNEEYEVNLILFFCCQDVPSILFRNELYGYKSYWNFRYSIYLSQYFNENIKYEEPIVKRKLLFKDIRYVNPNESDQYLLCGSETFMNEYKNLLLDINIPVNNIFLF